MKLSNAQWQAVFAARKTAADGSVLLDSGNELRTVAYVMVLEGSAIPNPTWSVWQSALDGVVQTMQPAPAMTHVELCLAPNSRRDDMHFATYLGSKAGWGSSFGGQRQFYLGHNAPNWRAVPIVCTDASARLRIECAKHVGTPYSLLRYMCALPPMRALAGLLPETAKTPAHCANLTARCLKAALPELKIQHSSNWFGPSTLFLELDSEPRRAAFHESLCGAEPSVRALADDEGETRATHELLNGSDDDIRSLDENKCILALRRLTIRALEPGLDEVARRIVQKQLATGLLRYSIVRSG